MKKTLLLLFTFYLFNASFGQNLTLTNQAEISVLTVGPGSNLSDAFGHSAFRIKDPALQLDVTYGYGEYDFDAPNFYLKFAQGKLNYLISKTNFNRFYLIYRDYYNRSLKEQVLNLKQHQKQALYNYLVNNYKPENRAYLYDFFFDNCATKIKDVAQTNTNNSIVFNLPENYTEATFRSLIQENLNRNTWGSLGIDIALGSVIDQTATPEEHMFLPKNIHLFFENATINNGMPLVKESHLLFEQKPTKGTDSLITSPLFVLGIISLFIIIITYKDFKNNRQSKWLDISLFIITGLVGVLILLLWFATNHQSTQNNYNLLWAFALNLFVVGQFFKKKISSWFKSYIKFLIIMLCLLTLHWVIGVQVFAIALLPVLIALAIRYLFLSQHYSRL
ncbi:DUF4105 domain-containing protein [Tamlana sp. 62-3]|uniref:DUF4105 domain-containing protein n=1 Tax=Neotamlana sargassicola TaxID=2883125 RepID=A0A9X1I6F1_9FLAO|nr:DUF4105 domain-containing protein [Tamlana sargassicola]MCB4808706.1 DUF4105 domain-containing protein [Tamlana sargassicola]